MFEEQLSTLPANPPRSPALLPGLRIASVLLKAGLAIPLAFVVMAILFPLLIFAKDPAVRLARGTTQIGDGRVIAVTANGCGGRGHEITYAFSPSNKAEYRATTSLCPGSPYYDLNSGDRLPVIYLASDPAVNAIAGAAGTNAPPFLIFLVFPFFVT